MDLMPHGLYKPVCGLKNNVCGHLNCLDTDSSFEKVHR